MLYSSLGDAPRDAMKAGMKPDTMRAYDSDQGLSDR